MQNLERIFLGETSDFSLEDSESSSYLPDRPLLLLDSSLDCRQRPMRWLEGAESEALSRTSLLFHED